MLRSVDEPSRRTAGRLAGGLALLSLLLGPNALAGPPVVHQVSPQARKSADRWHIEVERQGKDATIHVRGTHPGQPDCVQKPYLKVRYNPKKARLKTRQLARINCGTTEQSATITPKRRAFEFFINGELTAFIDLEGSSESGGADEPVVLPANPKPNEPVFVVVPAPAKAPGCHRITGVRARAAGRKISVKYKLRGTKGCQARESSYQVLAPVGPLRKGTWALKAPGGVRGEFGVGVVVASSPEPDDEEPGGEEPPAVARASTPAAVDTPDDEEDTSDDEEDTSDDEEDSSDDEEDTSDDEGDKPSKPPGPPARKPEPVPGVPANIDVY